MQFFDGFYAQKLWKIIKNKKKQSDKGILPGMPLIQTSVQQGIFSYMHTHSSENERASKGMTEQNIRNRLLCQRRALQSLIHANVQSCLKVVAFDIISFLTSHFIFHSMESSPPSSSSLGRLRIADPISDTSSSNLSCIYTWVLHRVRYTAKCKTKKKPPANTKFFCISSG